MKLATIGAGPSAFYVVSRILSRLQLHPARQNDVRIHMYDRNRLPYGLVRYGVAPDHPEVKNCTNKFESVLTEGRVKFLGGVNVIPPGGAAQKDTDLLNISLDDLTKNYTHVLLASGCPTPVLHPLLTPKVGVCMPALSMVNWYTSHPSSNWLHAPLLEDTEHVTIIGMGNVSLDIARMLLTPPHIFKARGAEVDIQPKVMDILERSKVRRVSIVGRRGVGQVGFTNKEVREMMEIPGVAFHPVDTKLLDSITPNGRQQARFFDLLRQGSKTPFHPEPAPTKSWDLNFFLSPTSLAPSPPLPFHNRKLELTVAHTMLSSDTLQAVTSPSLQPMVIPTDLVITSLGFQQDAPPFFDPALLDTESGRVAYPDPGPGMAKVYASGWAAYGAKGVLAKTLLDANKVGDAMLAEYLSSSDSSAVGDLEALPESVRKATEEGKVVGYP